MDRALRSPAEPDTDCKNVYGTDRQATVDEQLAGTEPATVLGQACQRLGIEIIRAWSPQAKGRIERCNGVYQDRRVQEIRLQGLETLDQVNALLEDFDEALNERFAVCAAAPQDWHRPLAADLDLADVFVFAATRTVQKDWTIRFENEWYQIAKSQRVRPSAKVRAHRRLDGSVQILAGDRALHYEKLPERPPRVAATRPSPKPKAKAKPPRPADDHPWRRPFLTPKRPPRLAL